MAGFINTENNNNHAGVERREASEKAEALLRIINDYRVYCNRFETLPTWDILEFLGRLQNELLDRYREEVDNWELDKARNDYFMVVGKKPFMAWSAEEVYKKIEEYKAEMQEKNKLDEHYLSTVKKNQWKKQMKR